MVLYMLQECFKTNKCKRIITLLTYDKPWRCLLMFLEVVCQIREDQVGLEGAVKVHQMTLVSDGGVDTLSLLGI